MKNPGRYHHMRVDWVGESSTRSITLCGARVKRSGRTDTLPRLRQGRRSLERLRVGTGEPARVI